MRSYLYALPALMMAAPLAAQSEGQLKSYFEGKTVVVKLDMPATDDGVDVYPTRARPVDFSKYARRIKAHGTAVKSGDSIVITKVKVKKDLIEFQLGGGGFGTFGDDKSTDVYVPATEKTRREKDLERDIKNEKDPEKRKAMSEELDALHKERDRQDALLKATTASAEQAKRENVRQQALTSGSRFNIRYDGGVSADALTPDAVMRALGQYVDFSGITSGIGGAANDTATTGRVGTGPAAPCASGALTLRRGLTEPEVESLLGKPQTIVEQAEGRLSTRTNVYVQPDRRVEALFVEGVLVRFTVTSK
jgi:hypothetical protein